MSAPPTSIRPASTGIDSRIFVACAVGVVAGAGHLMVSPRHFEEWVPYGVGVVVIGLAQIAWTVAVWRSASPGVLRAGVTLQLSIVGVWALSRTVGLPMGPAGVMPVIGFDVVLTIAGLYLAAAAVSVLRTPEQRAPGRMSAIEIAGVVLLVVSLGALIRGFGY